MSEVLGRGQHEGALSRFEPTPASVSLRRTLSSDSGTRDEDVIQVDTDMRGLSIVCWKMAGADATPKGR